MSVGLKLWVFLLGGATLLGAIWFLWSRLIGFPTHDPTASTSRHGPDGAGSSPHGDQHHPDHTSH